MTLPGPWNEVAGGYDEEMFPRTPELVDRALQLLAPRPDEVALDLATGPGSLAVRLAPLVARVTAVDFAESMIARLRAHIEERGLGNVEARVMDGQALELADGSFDLVVSMFGWFLFADRARGLAEIRRVLRPGGRVLVTSWMPPDRNRLLGAALNAIRTVLPDLPRPAGPLPTQIPEVVAGELRAAGLQEVATEVVEVSSPMRSIDEFWRVHERAGAPVVLLRKKLGDGWPRVSEAVLAHLRAEFGTGPVAMPAAAIYASAVC